MVGTQSITFLHSDTWPIRILQFGDPQSVVLHQKDLECLPNTDSWAPSFCMRIYGKERLEISIL